MAIKFIHARMPGRDQIHLVPAGRLEYDPRFGDGAYLTGRAMALCGKRSSAWLIDQHGERCERCTKRR